MNYIFSGHTSRPAKFIVINEDDWTIEKVANIEPGSYEIDSLTFGNKTVITKSIYGKSMGYGKVVPLATYCDEATESPVFTSNLPDDMETDDSVEVTISGGCQPYTWISENPNFVWEDTITSGTTNTLTCVGTDAAGGDLIVKDAINAAGVDTTGPATLGTSTALSDTTGFFTNVIFYCMALGCYNAGTTTLIEISPTHTVTSSLVLSAGCEGGGTGPLSVTVPEGKTSTISVQVNMIAYGYNGGSITGSAVMSVDACNSGCASSPAYIGYSTTALVLNGEYEFTVEGVTPSPYYSWSVEGGGTIVSTHSETRKLTYRAPSSNPGCETKPVISLLCDGSVIDTLNVYPTWSPSPYFAALQIGKDPTCKPYWQGGHTCEFENYNCFGQRMWTSTEWSWAGQDPCQTGCGDGQCPPTGGVCDRRTQEYINNGCCPPQLV